MRSHLLRIVLLVAALLAPASSSFAQTEQAKCEGDITIVRLSKIKPGGSLDGFMKAVEAHRAFYRANGVTDNQIVTARVLSHDLFEDEGLVSFTDDQVLSFHIRPPLREKIPGRGDAAFDAFVKLYRDNSEIASETVACMPKHGK